MTDFKVGDRVKITRPMLYSQRKRAGMVGVVSGVINNAEVGGEYLEIKFVGEAPFRVLASRCDLEVAE